MRAQRRPQARQAIERPVDAQEHAARFGVERFMPATDGHTLIADLHPAYLGWCGEAGHQALPAGVVAQSLAALFQNAGLRVVKIDGQAAVCGIELRRLGGTT